MFVEDLTPAEYEFLSKSRGQLALALLHQALRDQVPQGYLLSVDRDRMAANVLLAIRPAAANAGREDDQLHP